MDFVLRQFLRLLGLLLLAAFLGFCAAALSDRDGMGMGSVLALLLLAVLLLLLARREALRIGTPLRSMGGAVEDLEDLPRLWAEAERERGDLRAQAQREDALRRELLARLREGVVLLDPHRMVRMFNPAAQELLGLGLPIAQGTALSGLFREPEGLARIQEAYGGEAAEWTQLRGHRRLRIRALPMASGVLLTLDDITSQEQLETTRRKFISNVSHELKTPLTALRVAAENLQAANLDEEGQQAAGILTRSVERMALLIQDLAELSRIESGAVELRPEALDPSAFTLQLAADLEGMARTREVQVDLGLPPLPMAPFRADPLRLHQILENLLGNALKFSPAGSTVRLSLRPAAHGLRWEVEDHGPGIPLQDRTHVFERFYRSPATRAIPGTGLGLAIVKHLVRLMGGEVGFESEEGKGSRFWVELPGH